MTHPIDSRLARARRVSPARLAAAIALAALAACGAPTDPPITAPERSDVPPPSSIGTFTEPMSPVAVAAKVAAPVAAKASPFPDAAPVTRLGLYATPEQAARTLAANPGAALRVRVDTGGWDAADLAVRIIWGEQAAADLPGSVPVFVTGPDLRLAATVVDRLHGSGFSRVFLVAGGR
jgi:hypothetical protein